MTKTCPHCQATVLSTSQPDLPKPETMLTYASILEKPQYAIHNGVKYALATGEIVEAACAALRHCAALAATPAVGGEALECLIRNASLLLQNAEGCAVNHYGISFEQQGLPDWLADIRKQIETAALSLRAPPASPLRNDK